MSEMNLMPVVLVPGFRLGVVLGTSSSHFCFVCHFSFFAGLRSARFRSASASPVHTFLRRSFGVSTVTLLTRFIVCYFSCACIVTHCTRLLSSFRSKGFPRRCGRGILLRVVPVSLL